MVTKNRMDLIQSFERHPAKTSKNDPVDAGFTGFKTLIKEALYDPYKALIMAKDPFLPEWLNSFAREISATDDGGFPLRPALRRLIAQALEDEEFSLKFFLTLTSSNDADQRIKFLNPMFKILSGKFLYGN